MNFLLYEISFCAYEGLNFFYRKQKDEPHTKKKVENHCFSVHAFAKFQSSAVS